MRSDLRQVLFLAIFGFLCTLFVFFVPWGTSSDKDNDGSEIETTDASVDEDGEIEEDVYEVPQFDETLRIAVWKDQKTSLDALIDWFKSTHGGDIEVVEVELPNEWSGVSADLLLLPYDFLTGVSILENIGFQEEISPLFVSQLKTFVENHKEFLPFGIDLPVMYGLSSLGNGADGLIEGSSNRNPTRSYLSFNFGVSDSPSVLDNSIISAQQIIDFIEVNDIGGFSNWVDFTTASQETQKKLLASIQGSSEKCKEQPLSCLLEKNLLGVAWGFKSTYNKGFEDVLVSKTYPYEGKLPFVRLYGFVIPRNSQHYDMAIQFILDYMDLAFGDGEASLAYDAHLIPVFDNEFQKNCRQDSCGLVQNFTVLEDSVGKIERFMDDNAYWSVIEKKVQPNLYLNNTFL